MTKFKVSPALRAMLAREMAEVNGEEGPPESALDAVGYDASEHNQIYLDNTTIAIDEIEELDGDKWTALFKWGITLDKWLEIEIPHAPWIIPTILRRGGITMLSGQSKYAQKTTFLMALAISIVTGKKFAGIEPETTGPVLFILEEGAPVSVQARFKALIAGAAVPHNAMRQLYFCFMNSVKLNDKKNAWRKKILTTLDRIKTETGQPPVAIFLDNLSYLQIGDENDHSEAAKSVDTVQAWQRSGATIVLIAHLAKHIKRNQRLGDQIRGSTAWRDAFDFHIALRCYNEGDPLILEIEDRYGQPPPKRVVTWNIKTDSKGNWSTARLTMHDVEEDE